MKKTKLTIVLLILAVIANAQSVPVSWKKNFTGTINWQKVTTLGHYLVGTNSSLLSINPDSGQVIWSKSEYKNLDEGQVSQVGNSPLISINRGTSVNMIDPFTGESKFDSKRSGIQEIRDQIIMYNSNAILVSGRASNQEDILLLSSLTTGEIVWRLEDDFGRLITASDLSSSEILVVTLYNNYRVNTQSGKLIWKNDVSDANKQLDKLGAFGSLIKQAAANKVQDMDFNVQFYKNPFEPIFYIASEQEGRAKTSGFSSSTSNGGPSYHTTYTAFSLTDGNRIWSKDLDVNGKIGQLYFDKKGLVILPNDGLNTKINLYDYKTQQGMWGKKGKGLKIKGGIYDYLETDSGLLLISKKPNNKNYITYLDITSGNLAFEDPIKIEGEVVFAEMTPKGLLYITSSEVNILNFSSGKTLIDKEINTNPSLIDQNNEKLYSYDYSSSTIKVLDKNTGLVNKLGGSISFQGKESPSSLSIRNNGILISSAQNLALVDYSGKTVFQTYLEAPREPGIIRALRYAQAVRAAYIGAVSYAGAAAYQSAGNEISKDNQAVGSMVSGIGTMYEELGNQATDFAKKSWQMANTRFKATKEADDYTVILSQIDKTNYLMKVSKNTGKIEQKIDLGKDRNPSYAMDGVTGTVFYQTNLSEVTSYKF